MRTRKAPANLHWLLHHDAMWEVVIHSENNAQKSCQKHSSGDVCAFSLIGVLWVGYSWGIHGVFMGYTYVSVMCRLCIGYVSVKRRNIKGASGVDYSNLARAVVVERKMLFKLLIT